MGKLFILNVFFQICDYIACSPMNHIISCGSQNSHKMFILNKHGSSFSVLSIVSVLMSLAYILWLMSTDQLTGLPCLLPDVRESRPQTVVQLGEDLLVQQRHQSGLSHRGAEQGRQGWYPAHTTGLALCSNLCFRTSTTYCITLSIISVVLHTLSMYLLFVQHYCVLMPPLCVGVPDQLVQCVPVGAMPGCT